MVKYDTYVDSQTPYVGEIPSHWKMVQNKRVMHKEKRICESYNGQNIISLTLNGAIVRDLGAGGKMPATFDGYQHVYPGELLMCLFDIDVTPRCVGRINNEGLTSPAYSSFVLHDNANLGYYYYYYLMLDHTKELLHLAKNLRHSLTEEQIGQIKVPLPPISEQKAISEYLDKKTEHIDSIIAEAKASIEEYKAWKASIIYEAVTKGLDPNVEMKDSGVDWIGEIPATWSLLKITRVLDRSHPYPIGDGDHGLVKTTDYVDSGIPYIRVQNLGWGSPLSLENVVFITPEKNEAIKSSILKPNDILFAKTGGTIGKTGIVPETLSISNTTSHVGKITVSREYNPKYIFYVLSSNIGYNQFWAIASSKTTRPELSIDEIKSIRITMPQIRLEQDRIVEYLDQQCPQIDELISEKEDLIEDLEAYKKSLIFEVVTGKRKVLEL